MNTYESSIHSAPQTFSQMSLMVGVTPYTPWENVKPLMQHLGWEEGAQLSASSQVENDKGALYLLLHARPEFAIAHALDQGETHKQALADWQSEAEALLRHFKGKRSHTAMVEVHSAIQYPKQLLDWLARHHGAFKDLARLFPKGKIPSLTQPERPSELNLLLATQMVAQTPKLVPLMAQLEACSVPLGDDHYAAPLLDIDTAVVQRQAIVQSEQENVDLKDDNGFISSLSRTEDLKEENSLILKQLFQVQEELEKYYLEVQDKDTKLDQTHKELTQVSNRLKKVSSDRDIFKEKLLLMQNVLNQAQPLKLGSLLSKLLSPIRKLRRSYRVVKKQVNLVEKSDLFDREWYICHNPDVAALYSTNPAEHYVRHGGQEGRDPSPNFSTKHYLERNPDVAESGQNPLVHYLLHGKTEGRKWFS